MGIPVRSCPTARDRKASSLTHAVHDIAPAIRIAMNFFDTYEVPGTTTPPANPQPQPSLNEEVEQVVGQLSRFWGGFRKQVRILVPVLSHLPTQQGMHINLHVPCVLSLSYP